jgi:hypothetical protein
MIDLLNHAYRSVLSWELIVVSRCHHSWPKAKSERLIIGPPFHVSSRFCGDHLPHSSYSRSTDGHGYWTMADGDSTRTLSRSFDRDVGLA